MVIVMMKKKTLMKMSGKDILDWTISSVFADRDVKVDVQDDEDGEDDNFDEKYDDTVWWWWWL